VRICHLDRGGLKDGAGIAAGEPLGTFSSPFRGLGRHLHIGYRDAAGESKDPVEELFGGKEKMESYGRIWCTGEFEVGGVPC